MTSKFVDITRNKGRVLAGAAMAAGAVMVGILASRRRPATIDLPEPGALAAETAVSVHNAAKATVISAVREADEPDTVLLKNTAREAMREGVWAGADLAAVAAGVVEGAVAVAHLLGDAADDVASAAAVAAMEVADAQGTVASARIREMLAPHGLVG